MFEKLLYLSLAIWLQHQVFDFGHLVYALNCAIYCLPFGNYLHATYFSLCKVLFAVPLVFFSNFSVTLDFCLEDFPLL